MKKIICLVLALIIMLAVFASCSIDDNYSVSKVHIISTGECYEIETWVPTHDKDYVNITTKDGDHWFIHSNQIILIEGKCPICDN